MRHESAHEDCRASTTFRPALLRRSRITSATPPCRLLPVAAAWALAGGAAFAQGTPAADGIVLRLSPTLSAPPRGDAAKELPVIVQGNEIRGRPDLETVVEGDAEFRRGGMLIRADRLSYDHPEDLATARGNVRISRDGNVYTGPELQLRVQRFEGYFLNPTYYFSRVDAGGSAKRIDFIDDQRAIAHGATYTSCPADGSGDPAWLLSTSRVKMDFEANEGIAEGAVLRFMGVPILAAPVLSFPLTEERKSGWLPPSITPFDNRSGLQVSVPYYWNIAPNRDATITPGVSAKRGASLGAEFRYLEPRHSGLVDVNTTPEDRLYGRSRWSTRFLHDAALPGNTLLSVRTLRVSDDDHWKDFPDAVPTLTPRLLLSEINVTRPVDGWTTYARAMRWQVLQNSDGTKPVASSSSGPLVTHLYERAPQIGARTVRRFGNGLELGFEGEFNRFSQPANLNDSSRPEGMRVHALASIARPWLAPGWNLTPRLTVNAASYGLEEPLGGRKSLQRVIPTFSLDSAWVMERETRWFGRDVQQTLEPRLLYVNTPYRRQDHLPNFDSAAKDFNFESIFTDNAFSGIDRVSDAHQLTAGVTTRVIDPGTGAETMRLGVVQRYLFRDQRITPEGQPLTQRFSDILLLGSSTVIPRWTLDAFVQYNSDRKQMTRSILGMRYSPGPYRTVNALYRLAREPSESEQVEFGWQWPIYGQPPSAASASRAGSKDCKGTLFGVGRVNYSIRDSRVTDAIAGIEYDAGCWIGRVVAKRQSTGPSEARTRLMVQLELVGLSKLGSNPLQVLKDNIPGYRLLREEPSSRTNTTVYD